MAAQRIRAEQARAVRLPPPGVNYKGKRKPADTVSRSHQWINGMTKKITDVSAKAIPSTPDGVRPVKFSPEWPEDKVLGREAKILLGGLPEEVRPQQLAEKYPRICNRLAELWSEPELVIHYFDDLLIDNRGGREGFPLGVLMEISKLKEHFLASYVPAKLDVWRVNRKLV